MALDRRRTAVAFPLVSQREAHVLDAPMGALQARQYYKTNRLAVRSGCDDQMFYVRIFRRRAMFFFRPDDNETTTIIITFG